MKVSSLKLDARNVKKHPAKQIEAIAKSIGKYGYIQPIVVDEDFNVIIGNGRLQALIELGYQEVKVVQLTGISAQEKRALAVLDNKIPSSEWNVEVLKEDLPELVEAGLFTGFTDKELVKLLKEDYGPVEEPTYPLAPRLDEQYDYILLFFKKDIDFLYASQVLQLGPAKSRVKDEVGLLRAVDGVKALELIRKIEVRHTE